MHDKFLSQLYSILAERKRLRSPQLLQAAIRCATYYKICINEKSFKMKKGKIISFILVVSLVVFLIIPKKILVIYQNSMENKFLNIELLLDGKKIENKEIAYSFAFPNESTLLKTNIGFHTILIKSKELKIEKSVKVFTLFKNNIEFEFIGNEENGFDVIERDSWFTLVLE
jgi:hypothetical protein